MTESSERVQVGNPRYGKTLIQHNGLQLSNRKPVSAFHNLGDIKAYTKTLAQTEYGSSRSVRWRVHDSSIMMQEASFWS